MSILESVFILLSSAMKNTKYFGEVFPFVVSKSDGENSFPAYYKNSGEFDKLILEDKFQGVTYFRKDGTIRTTVNTDEKYNTVSCAEILYNISIPIKQIIFLPKEKVSCDNAFAEDDFALQIVSRLTDKNLGNYIQNVREISFTNTGYETDSIEVLKNEYSNYKNIVDINYNNIYISIDWELFLVADSACLDSCENPVGLPGVPIVIVTAKPPRIANVPHTNPSYETITGAINNANTIFTLPENYLAGSLLIFLNGQQTAFFTEISNNQFQTGWVPKPGQQITAHYTPIS